MAQGRPRVGLARRSGVGTRAQAGDRKDEVMNQDPGMPLNALDQLRSLTIALRMGVSGEAAAMTLGLEPAAYDFACALIVALTESGNLGILGPLPPEATVAGPAT